MWVGNFCFVLNYFLLKLQHHYTRLTSEHRPQYNAVGLPILTYTQFNSGRYTFYHVSFLFFCIYRCTRLLNKRYGAEWQ